MGTTLLDSKTKEVPFAVEHSLNSNVTQDEDVLFVESRTFLPLCHPERISTNFIKNITVEPSIIGTMYIIIMYSMLAKEYIYSRIALDYNLTVTERGKSCNATTANSSDPEYILQEKVSAETANWMMYTLTSSFFVATFTTIFLGSWSDKVGRKFPLLISHFGFFILILTYVIVVNLNLPVPVLLAGHVLCGLCGDLGTVLGCSFSYIADITDRTRRTFRMTVIEMCIGLGGFVASLSGGAWVQAQGFKNPFWFLLAVSVFDFVYILLRLPSTHHDGKVLGNFKHLCTKEPFVHMYQVLKPQANNTKRHINLILYFVCFLILAMTFVGVRDILVIYEIGLPFCWDALLVGISLALSQLGYFVSILLVKIFSGSSAELKLVIFGAILTSASCLVLAFARSSWMIFLGIALQLCFNLPSPIIRSQASRLVSNDEVGSVFALLSCAHNIGGVLATFLFNGVFSATVDSPLPGAVFLLGTALFVIFTPLYGWAYQRSKDSLAEDAHRYDRMVNEDEQQN